MDNPKVETPDGETTNKVRSYVALALVGVAAVLLIAWLLQDDGDSGGSDSGEAEIVTAEELREASSEGTPIYWAGERLGTELELSRPDGKRTYVRYLTDGAKAGDSRPGFLTIGTYESADPEAALQRQGKREGGVLGKAPGGAIVYFERSQPQSVYVAFPEVDAQIEVYDPDFQQALQLVNSGQIVPAD